VAEETVRRTSRADIGVRAKIKAGRRKRDWERERVPPPSPLLVPDGLDNGDCSTAMKGV
jgi:hypothetical protein